MYIMEQGIIMVDLKELACLAGTEKQVTESLALLMLLTHSLMKSRMMIIIVFCYLGKVLDPLTLLEFLKV